MEKKIMLIRRQACEELGLIQSQKDILEKSRK